MKKSFLLIAALILGFTAFFSVSVSAGSDCIFDIQGPVMTLTGDCTTDEAISVPDGFTLEGAGYLVTVVDPPGGHFVGAVVENAGATADVHNLWIDASNLTNVCDSGANRLRGILLRNASGSITRNGILGLNQGPSGCQEGNGIEVRNDNPLFQETVEISHNLVLNYQKTGVLITGNVKFDLHHNDVGASATQENLAANSVQISFGATGLMGHNHIEGNQWLGPSNFAATSLLLFEDSGVTALQNNIGGNSDVAVFSIDSVDLLLENNRVFDEGEDGPHGDFGIALLGGSGNLVTNNKIKGFMEPIFGFDLGDNKVIPAEN